MILLTFIETSFFTKAITTLFTDEEYGKIQDELMLNPTKGDLIQGTGGLRKIRFGLTQGKSGGVRILYYYTDEHGRIYMIAVYPKSKKDSLTNAEKAVFKKLIEQLKQELKDGQSII